MQSVVWHRSTQYVTEPAFRRALRSGDFRLYLLQRKGPAADTIVLVALIDRVFTICQLAWQARGVVVPLAWYLLTSFAKRLHDSSYSTGTAVIIAVLGVG